MTLSDARLSTSAGMPWQRSLIPDSMERQMLSDRAQLNAGMTDLRLSDGEVLRCFQAGQGEAILFVPVISEVNFVYAPQIAQFSAKFRTIAYDPSVRRTRRFSIRDRAEQTIYVLDALGIQAAHLVAWSDVGAAAYDLARRWPDRCRSLVLFCLPDRYALPPMLKLLCYLLKHLPIENLTPDFFVRYVLSCYLRGPRIPHRLISSYARRIPRLTALYKYSILPNLYQHVPVADEVIAPAAVITGEFDALASAMQARRMAALLPNARPSIVIERGEHLLPFTQPNEVNQIMESFYRTIE